MTSRRSPGATPPPLPAPHGWAHVALLTQAVDAGFSEAEARRLVFEAWYARRLRGDANLAERHGAPDRAMLGGSGTAPQE